MKIAVRLDDITPDMDWEGFLQFKALLDRYQVKPLIGVIPDNKDENLKGSSKGCPEDFWAYIRDLQSQGWMVAMHGYRHIYNTRKGGLFPLNNFSEFAGKPYEEQFSMLKCGKKILEEKGIFTDLFMAPAHSYDFNTLKALKKAGFKALTDGFGNSPYRYCDLVFYPISFKLSNTLKKKKGYSTMVVHTGTISKDEFASYEEYFRRRGITWVDYSEYLKQTPKNRGLLGRCGEWFMAKGKGTISYILGWMHK